MAIQQLSQPTPPHPGRAAPGTRELAEALHRTARTAAHSLGFEVVVNLQRPGGAYEVVVSVGIPEGMLGGVTPAEVWDELLQEEYRISDSYLVPPAAVRAVVGAYEGAAWSLSDSPPAAHPDAWDRYHILIVPLGNRAGDLIGNFSVDRPSSGRAPDAGRIRHMAPHSAVEWTSFGDSRRVGVRGEGLWRRE